jgi:hypothetical protein
LKSQNARSDATFTFLGYTEVGPGESVAVVCEHGRVLVRLRVADPARSVVLERKHQLVACEVDPAGNRDSNNRRFSVFELLGTAEAPRYLVTINSAFRRQLSSPRQDPCNCTFDEVHTPVSGGKWSRKPGTAPARTKH